MSRFATSEILITVAKVERRPADQKDHRAELEAVTRPDGRSGRVDILTFRSRRDDNSTESLVIELERPTVKAGSSTAPQYSGVGRESALPPGDGRDPGVDTLQPQGVPDPQGAQAAQVRPQIIEQGCGQLGGAGNGGTAPR
jgi:hypothetical protein